MTDPPSPPHPDRDALTPEPADPRARPFATQEMASMFDDVSGRYDLLNRILTLGRDHEWRRAMWDEVPEESRTVLDLCTGSGVSLPGLRRPGRLVIGIDVSLRMLELAARTHQGAGWAPRLVCADAFHLPFRSAALDAVTIAFGVRNLRPRAAALAEIARMLRPGGVLVVLEATAPRPGPLAPLHLFYLRWILPLAGSFSNDPSAYAYLARSIVEFGPGTEFEEAFAVTGFTEVRSRPFLLGATRLWSVRLGPGAEGSPPALQGASTVSPTLRELPHRAARDRTEWRWWTGFQLAFSAALFAALVVALVMFINSRAGLALPSSWRPGARTLLLLGIVAFGIRTVVLWLRFRSPPPRR